MIVKGSRYETTRGYDPDPSRGFSFEGVRPRDMDDAPGVLEHTIREGDRIDLLALYYYNDPRKWWRILDANPEILCGGELDAPENIGRILLIPRVQEKG